MGCKINVSKIEFRKIKSGKQTVLVRLNNSEDFKKIKNNSKITLQVKVDRFNKKVNDIKFYSNLDELSKNVEKKELGFKKKENFDYNSLIENYNNYDIKKYGFVVIEFKKKKHIFRKILLVIILLLFVKYFINNFITNIKINKFKDSINNIEKEKISYAFIEINPSFVLAIKNGKVNDVACLNDDCIEIYNEIDVKGKTIDESVNNLYKLSKEKGYDTSNGVKIKTTDKIEIKKKDYISIEYIDSSTKSNLLSNIKNNEQIKNSNDNYYANLWEELKKDKDYGIVYECNMNNEELECNIKRDFAIHSYTDEESKSMTDKITIARLWNTEITPKLSKIARVLKKFNVEVGVDNELGFIINPIGYIYINGVKYSTVVIPQTTAYIEYDTKIRCDIYGFKLIDINLLKPNAIPTHMILDDGETPVDTTLHENKYFICGEYNCTKKIDRNQWYCEYNDSEEYGNWINKYETIYQLCDNNKNNCHDISFDEFANNNEIIQSDEYKITTE